jgi:sugar lactone lactonase YvrE
LVTDPNLARGALASDSQDVYWTGGIWDRVKKMPAAGGTPVTLWNGSAQAASRAIALDATHVYWATLDLTTAKYSLSRVPIAGGSREAVVSDQPIVDHIAVDSTGVYWTGVSSEGGSVVKTPLAGGASTTLATHRGVTGIAIDGANVYFTTVDLTDTKKGAIMKVAKAGGAPVQLATGESATDGAIAVDATSIYWAAVVDGAHDFIRKVPISGGAVTTLATDVHWPVALAVDGAAVYFTTSGRPTDPSGVSGSLTKVSLDGGPSTTLARRLGSPGSVALGGARVFWETDFFQGKILSIDKDPCQNGVCAE